MVGSSVARAQSMCSGASMRGESSGALSRRGDAVDIFDVLDGEALRAAGVFPADGPPNATALAASGWHRLDVCIYGLSTVRLSLHASCARGGLPPASEVEASARSTRPYEVPLECLRLELDRALRAHERVWLSFSSTDMLVAGCSRASAASPALHLRPGLQAAAARIVDGFGAVAQPSGSARPRLACAHVRSGLGAGWDAVGASPFKKQLRESLAALRMWLEAVLGGGFRVLISTDGGREKLGRRLGVVARDCLAAGRCAFVEDLIRARGAQPQLRAHPSLEEALLSQEACALADALFLTRGSSYSRMIEDKALLRVRRRAAAGPGGGRVERATAHMPPHPDHTLLSSCWSHRAAGGAEPKGAPASSRAGPGYRLATEGSTPSASARAISHTTPPVRRVMMAASDPAIVTHSSAAAKTAKTAPIIGVNDVNDDDDRHDYDSSEQHKRVVMQMETPRPPPASRAAAAAAAPGHVKQLMAANVTAYSSAAVTTAICSIFITATTAA